MEDGFCCDMLYAGLLDVGFRIWKVGVAACLNHSMDIVCNQGWVCERPKIYKFCWLSVYYAYLNLKFWMIWEFDMPKTLQKQLDRF